MTWRAYQVVLRLRSPLHIGCGRVGNLQRTRPYVTGRVLWGALTMRLTRDAAQGGGAASDSRQYRQVGDQVRQSLAFTYLYPALESGADYQVVWPWEDESSFRYRFLSSYQGTALCHGQRAAAEGTLHEVEFLSPNARDSGERVYLKGYAFERDGCTLNWQSALRRLQMGGERGYGWGSTELADLSLCSGGDLFCRLATFQGNGDIPVVHLVPPKGRLLAHAFAGGLPAAGDVEPLVGREWRSDAHRRHYVGQHVTFGGMFFAPGTVVQEPLAFRVEDYGVWRGLDAAVQ